MGIGAQPPMSPGQEHPLTGRASDVGTSGAPATTARVPDFFIVGHQKCGTTALYEMLRGHPGIFMPTLKEPRFFATDLRSRLRPRSGAGADNLLPQTLEAYLALFADARADQLAGDASPQYLRSRAAAGAIAGVAPEARIIAILREPASFVRSFHQQWLHANQETETDLRAAIGLEAARREGRKIPRSCHQPSELAYCEHVRYVEQLRRFEGAFERERMLVLIYDDFRRDNLASASEILRFLGLDDSIPLTAVETKPLRRVRSPMLHRLTFAARRARRHPSTAGRTGALLGSLSSLPVRSSTLRRISRRLTYSEPAAPDADFALELRRRFKPEVVALSDYLGRDLVSLWGYDSIG
jgi:Sulfotransferase family